jgi:hypothetical protein
MRDKHALTRAARLLATAREAGAVDAPPLRIGPFMVVDEANGLGLGRGRGSSSFRSSIRGRRGSTLIHEKVQREGRAVASQ